MVTQQEATRNLRVRDAMLTDFRSLPPEATLRDGVELLLAGAQQDFPVLDIHGGQTIGLVIETQCNYFAPLAFPQTVEAGIRVARLGASSVRYEVGLFAGGEPLTAAAGHFIHVYVDRTTRRPVPVPDSLRDVFHCSNVALSCRISFANTVATRPRGVRCR